VVDTPQKTANLIYIPADEFVSCEDIAFFHRNGGRAPNKKLPWQKRFLFWVVVLAVGWLAIFLVLSPLVRLLENLWQRIS
jgi:hypothetical protein